MNILDVLIIETINLLAIELAGSFYFNSTNQESPIRLN